MLKEDGDEGVKDLGELGELEGQFVKKIGKWYCFGKQEPYEVDLIWNNEFFIPSVYPLSGYPISDYDILHIKNGISDNGFNCSTLGFYIISLSMLVYVRQESLNEPYIKIFHMLNIVSDHISNLINDPLSKKPTHNTFCDPCGSEFYNRYVVYAVAKLASEKGFKCTCSDVIRHFETHYEEILNKQFDFERVLHPKPSVPCFH